MASAVVAPRLGDQRDLTVCWGTQTRLRCCHRYLIMNGLLVHCSACGVTYQQVPGSDRFLVVNTP